MGILHQRMRKQKAREYYHQHLVSNHKDLPPIPIPCNAKVQILKPTKCKAIT